MDMIKVLAPAQENASELPENAQDILPKIEQYCAAVTEMKKIVREHPELRLGNILNAVMKAHELISEEGKGVLPELKQIVLAGEIKGEKFALVVGRLRQKHEAIVKFLEGEAKVAIKE